MLSYRFIPTKTNALKNNTQIPKSQRHLEILGVRGTMNLPALGFGLAEF